MSTNKFASKMKSLVAVTSCSSLILAGLLYNKNDEKFFDNFAMPFVNNFLSPENAYKLGIFLCKWDLMPKNSYVDPSNLVKLIISLIIITCQRTVKAPLNNHFNLPFNSSQQNFGKFRLKTHLALQLDTIKMAKHSSLSTN